MIHKTEAGAVAIGLADGDALSAALDTMAARTGAEKFLIERMIGNGVAELILGIASDEAWGPCLMLGSGGVLAELVTDRALLPLPATPGEIDAALRSLRIWPLIDGYRGRPAGDASAVRAAAAALADLAVAESGRIVEGEINPLIVRPDGRGAVAVDAALWVKADSREDAA
jgi:acetyl-CoA synthetase